MEPMERSVSHGTDTESMDTVATNQSMGPALVGNVSVDSLDDQTPISLGQLTPPQEQGKGPQPAPEQPQQPFPVKQEPIELIAPGVMESRSESEEDIKHPREQPQEPIEALIHETENPEDKQRSGSEIMLTSAEESNLDPTHDQDQEDNKREQQEQEKEQDPTPTGDQSARMSIADLSEGVQVQGFQRELANDEDKELAYQLKREEESEKDKGGVKEEKVDVGEQKVDFIEGDLKHEPLELQDERREQNKDQEQGEKSIDTSISLIKLHDTSNNELFHHTFKTAANTSQDSHQSEEEPKENKGGTMEFTKNYSDDLISSELHRTTSADNNNDSNVGGQDLADFELPPYSGSSSNTSDQAATKHSPAKQRKSSNSMATQASSTYHAPGTSASVVANDLSAVRNVLKSTYSRFSHVFQWKRPIESGIIFAIGLTLIIALTFFSIISVVAYSALGVICASGLLRIYKTGMKALNRSPETPVDRLWNQALGLNVSLSPERLHEILDTSHANLNASMVYFKQVLLVEDKLATLKFSLFLYSLTYIGAWFNGLTLITLIYLALFSAPLFYEKNKTKIDEYMDLATKQVSSSISMVTDRVGSVLGSQTGGGSKKQN